MKKIKIKGEIIYLLSLVIMAFSVAMTSASDFGVSMIAAPAYMLSKKIAFLTFGQSEYIIQAILFTIMCLLIKKIKPIYFMSFVTCLIYGAILDGWIYLIPAFNGDVSDFSSYSIPLRIVFLLVGMTLTSLAVALSLKTYIYANVYDFFIKVVPPKFNIELAKFKTAYDIVFLLVSITMSLIFFGRFNGIGIGTFIMVAVNGSLIGMFCKLIDKYLEITPLSHNLEKKFEI